MRFKRHFPDRHINRQVNRHNAGRPTPNGRGSTNSPNGRHRHSRNPIPPCTDGVGRQLYPGGPWEIPNPNPKVRPMRLYPKSWTTRREHNHRRGRLHWLDLSNQAFCTGLGQCMRRELSELARDFIRHNQSPDDISVKTPPPDIIPPDDY